VASVRLISATHLPLRQYIESDRFRKDLFYRLSGITLTLPPLRDRPLDLRSLIASEIVAASRRQGKTVVGLDAEAMDRLAAYAWPGNLRELNRVIHVAVALSPGEIVPAVALILEPPTPDENRPAGGTRPLPDASHALRLKSVERQHIRRVLEQMGGNKRQTAIVLGISRSTLDRKLSRPPRARSASV
jgi:two-component system, NtrC family, response regulator HydG